VFVVEEGQWQCPQNAGASDNIASISVISGICVGTCG